MRTAVGMTAAAAIRRGTTTGPLEHKPRARDHYFRYVFSPAFRAGRQRVVFHGLLRLKLAAGLAIVNVCGQFLCLVSFYILYCKFYI
jgi:hypothetical protein